MREQPTFPNDAPCYFTFQGPRAEEAHFPEDQHLRPLWKERLHLGTAEGAEVLIQLISLLKSPFQ